ncbi:MAG: SEC-C metal-binding domain-containing protein [Syntrophomonas sp.]
MKYTSIGRNDPCPCGSGKKYKKCCAVLEELGEFSTDPFTRYNQFIMAIKIKLDQFYGQQIKKVRKTTLEQFLRFTVQKSLPAEHESLFSDWLWFDKTDEEEETLGFYYLKANNNYMEGPMAGCLSALNFSYLSVYEVTGFDDMNLEVEDIFSANRYKVLLKEPWDIDISEQPVLILGRLVMLTSDENIFSGMVLISDNKSGQKDFIKEHFEYIRVLYDEKLMNMLKFNGEIVYGIFDHAFKKILINMNDIQSISIDEKDANMLQEQLLTNPDYVMVHKTEGFTWFKPVREVYGYVRIAFGEGYVLSCAEILDDILEQKQFLQSILPEREFVNLNNRFLIQPPPLELADLWFMILKDKECERWLDIPQKELDSHTPREYLEEADGVLKLTKLLVDFAETLEGENEKELIDYMKKRIAK